MFFDIDLTILAAVARERELQRALAAERMTMIVVTHEMAFAREAATNVIFMENGVIVEQGEPQTFFRAPKEERTREFLRNML